MTSDDEVLFEDIIEAVNSYLPENQKFDSKKKNILLTQVGAISAIVNSATSKKEFELGIEFSKEAVKDLERSKKAYNEMDYAESIYHLQQSAEKLTKAFGLIQGNITSKDLSKVKHKTPRAFITMIENKGDLVKVLKETCPELNTNTDYVKNVIDNRDKEIALMSDEQLVIFLKIGERIDEALALSKIDDTLKKILPDLARLHGKKKYYPNFLISKYGAVFIKLFLIAAVTYPHEAFTRYPDRDIKPAQYNENMGIVKVAPQAFDILDESIDCLRKYVEWKNEK